MKNYIVFIILASTLTSCSKESFPASTSQTKLYDEFWNHVNDNYIYFEEKNVDWQSIYQTYKPDLNDNSSDEELLQAMENSLLELRDGHNLLRTPIRNSLVYDFKEGYDTSYSPELVEQKYITSPVLQTKSFRHGNMDNGKTIYIQIPKMEFITSLQELIRSLIQEETETLILDLRNNGGGDSNPIPELLGDFVTERTLLGSYIEKSGPEREDETEPINIYANPSDDTYFDIDVFLLINRGGFSATSYFAAMAQGLPNFILVGQVTGGGGGGNAGFELSNGWLLALSVSDFIDKNGKTIENGVDPDVFVENTESDISDSRDIMLEKVLELAGK